MPVRLTAVSIVLIAALAFSCGKDSPTQPPPPSAKPAELRASGGPYYKGSIGDTTFVPKLRFSVLDSTGHAVKNTWVYFSLVEGDGTLIHDSLKSDDSGLVRQAYDFTGSLGYATVRALVRDVDTVDAFLRASVISPGENGQGQYVRFLDSYATVKKLNGNPVVVQPDSTYYINYVDYEASLGVVVMLYDSDHNNAASDTESVYGVILDGVYGGKTHAGWGVDSPIDSIIGDLGQPDSLRLDIAQPPPAYLYKWLARGIDVYTDTSSTASNRHAFEIHISDPTPNMAAPAGKLAGLRH